MSDNFKLYLIAAVGIFGILLAILSTVLTIIAIYHCGGLFGWNHIFYGKNIFWAWYFGYC